MAAFFYILRCADGTFYVGHTTDLQTRLAVGPLHTRENHYFPGRFRRPEMYGLDDLYDQ